MQSIESVGATKDWKEDIRLKLNLSSETFTTIKNLSQQVQEKLEEIGVEIIEQQEQILLHKIGLFVRANGNNSAETIADAVSSLPQVLQQKGKPDIGEAVAQAQQKQSKKSATVWRNLSERKDDVPMIAERSLGDGTYYLGRLFTRGHFIANSATLEHCLGRKSLERYFSKSKNKDIEVYAVMQQSDSEPVATIIYDVKLKSIVQIKQVDDQHLIGEEPYFDAVVESLSSLITEESIDEVGRAYQRPIESVQDLERVFRGFPEVFVRSGTLVSISDALAMDPKEVLGGSAFSVDEKVEPLLIAQISEKLPLAIDMTLATEAQRAAVKEIAGTLIDNRLHVEGFPHLKVVKGQILANYAEDIRLEALEEVERGIYATQAKRASFPRLQRTGGRIDLPTAQMIEAEELAEVAGNIDASSAVEITLPNLRRVGWHIEADTARQINLPNLTHVGGKIFGDSAISINTPKLKNTLTVQCNQATDVVAGPDIFIERKQA